ncbi:MAG TPA: DUF5987 family protein [Mycobacteriales bacterium]|jgi:hypothetical protein|nr:DUF5987 family protein [Mycobacteriales bacterium]
MSLSRRQLLWLAAIGSAAWPIAGQAATRGAAAPGGSLPLPPDPVSLLGTTSDPETMTLEAFADTLIPGRKRYAADAAIAGVGSGAGAVQAGALDLMRFGPVGIAPLLPGLAAAIDAEAAGYALAHKHLPDPTLPPFVALPYDDRKVLATQLLENSRGDLQLVWFALAGLVFLAYHTAGYLPTADAVRHGHPGLAAIGFPKPDADDLWRFPVFSYRRELARLHPHTTARGNPR